MDKAERQLNLVIALVSSEFFRTADWIHRSVAGYPPDDKAFFRTFERDKGEIRDLGIPLVTDSSGRYRILHDEFAIADMHFTPAEWAAVMLATRLWSTTSLAAAQHAARRKLAEAHDGDAETPGTDLLPLVHIRETAFDPLLSAIVARRQVIFDYRKPDQTGAQRRHVQPWTLGQTKGRWYLIGFDSDRGAQRTFRLSRITSAVQVKGPAGAYEIPETIDTAAILQQTAEPAAVSQAIVEVAAGYGDVLRRMAASADGDRLTINYAVEADLARTIAALGPQALVWEPPSLRQLVIDLLRGAEQVPSC